jgi:hypothetical protein
VVNGDPKSFGRDFFFGVVAVVVVVVAVVEEAPVASSEIHK